MKDLIALTITVNGAKHQKEVEPRLLLSDFLRHDLELTGTHVGCEHGVCGACTVLIGDRPVRSCLMFAVQADGLEIMTVEGLGTPLQPHALQATFVELGAVQCGYCTPGMILAAKQLLDRVPSPTEDDVKEAMDGNLCRCTGYVKPIEAVLAAAQKIREEKE